MHSCGIYRITNRLTGDYYGGSSTDIKRRWRYHKYDSKKYTKFYNALRKYGFANFELKLLVVCSKENLLFYEQRWLDKNCGKEECYNTSLVAKAPFTGLHHTEESKRKIGDAFRGKKLPKKQIIKAAKARAISIKINGMKHSKWSHPMSLANKKIQSRIHSKTWTFINPLGATIKIFNLAKFCEENELSSSCMQEVAKSIHGRTQHKGWRIKHALH